MKYCSYAVELVRRGDHIQQYQGPGSDAITPDLVRTALLPVSPTLSFSPVLVFMIRQSLCYIIYSIAS